MNQKRNIQPDVSYLQKLTKISEREVDDLVVEIIAEAIKSMIKRSKKSN